MLRPKIKKPFLLIISHKNSNLRECRNKELLNPLISNYYYYYFIGDINLESDYVVDDLNRIVYLKVSDNYESLSLKVYAAFKFIYENFSEKISGVFKTDDDIVLDLNKINNLNNKHSNIDYFGLKNQNSQEYSSYHFGKCESDFLNKTPMKIPITDYCSGGGYYINVKNIKYILSNHKIFLTTIYEDVSIGYSLKLNNIEAIDIDVKNNGFFW